MISCQKHSVLYRWYICCVWQWYFLHTSFRNTQLTRWKYQICYWKSHWYCIKTLNFLASGFNSCIWRKPTNTEITLMPYALKVGNLIWYSAYFIAPRSHVLLTNYTWKKRNASTTFFKITVIWIGFWIKS